MTKKKTLKPKAQTTTDVVKPAAVKAAAPAPTVTKATKAPAKAAKPAPAKPVATEPKPVAAPKPEPAKAPMVASKPAPAPAPAPVVVAETPKPAPKPAPAPKPSQAFELEAPSASAVFLAGDFTGWDSRPIALSKEGNGRWKASITLEPGTYEYRFIVDGAWTDDPKASARSTNPFGTTNCIREVSSN